MIAPNPNPPDFPSEWSNCYGQDRFGLWQGLEIKGVRQIMRWIPPGRFLMGSPAEEVGRFEGENQHHVTITKGFWLADTTCTQGLWRAVMNDNPSHFENGSEFPVDNISWDDCQLFIEQANQLISIDFKLRLPTEAEWEYAARAGTQTAFWWGDTITADQANFYQREEQVEFRESTVEVLSFEPNPLGLFQVHGNLLEWCQDWYSKNPEQPVSDAEDPASGQYRVVRGGCWFDDPRYLRAASRRYGMSGRHPSDGHLGNCGFRLAGG